MTQLRIIAGVWGPSPAQDIATPWCKEGDNPAESFQKNALIKALFPPLSKLSFLSSGRVNGMKPFSSSGSHFQIQDGLRAQSPQKTLSSHWQPSQFCLRSPWAKTRSLNNFQRIQHQPHPWGDTSCSSPPATSREFQDLWQKSNGFVAW